MAELYTCYNPLLTSKNKLAKSTSRAFTNNNDIFVLISIVFYTFTPILAQVIVFIINSTNKLYQ